MAFTWADTFVPPTASGGLTDGDYTAVDEWPWTSDECYLQTASGGSGTVTFTFDMSNGPGDKKGFRAWFRAHCHENQSVGWNITEVRLTDGTSTLWTSSGLTINIPEDNDSFAASKIAVIDIPDSAMSTDPTISGLVLELDCDNLDSGNGRLSFTGMRMSKSPFTAAQEADVPSSLSGADFSCYRAEDRSVLGAADGETWVVWPDASGNGRHLIQLAGTTATIEDDTIDYVNFPSTANRFASHFGERVTGNHIWHSYWYMVDTTAAQVVTSFATDFAGVVSPSTDPNDKNLVGVDDNGSAGDDRVVIMSGDGTGPAHIYGSTVISFDTWYRTTLWVQDSGNEHLWFNDDATPDTDSASGSNNMFTISVGNRESDDRRFQGRVAEVWWIDGDGFTEANIDDARDEWVNGASAQQDLTGTTFQKAPTFPQGGVAPGSVTLSGATFQKAPTFPQGAVAPGSVNVSGTTFAKAPTFPQGEVSQVTSLTGTTFEKSPTFPQGDVAVGDVTLTGSAFQKAPTFPQGEVVSDGALTGTTFTKAPTFPQGEVVVAGALTGTVFQKAPSFPQGEVAPGSVTVTGTVFQKGPVFPTGSVGGVAEHPSGPATAPLGATGSSTIDTSTTRLAAELASTGVSDSTPSTGMSTAPIGDSSSEAE